MLAPPSRISKHYLALCGGVGGAKLALGFAHVLSPDQLTIIVNTGDDFEHLGLSICPDIDTVSYTLAGLVQPDQGWGRSDESFVALDIVKRLGGETWFQLGDKDIGLHLMRSMLLDQGLSLSAITAQITRRLGIVHEIAPMTDDIVRTVLDTAAGPLPFQRYFVKARCEPVITGIRYLGAEQARPSAALNRALADPDLSGVFICPSNPYLSIDPILALANVRKMLASTSAPVIAVAPIVGGRAIKGPAIKIMRELAIEPSAAAVAAYYADFLDGYIVDAADRVTLPGMQVIASQIVMSTLADKVALARRCLAFSNELAEQP
ncbi:MAG: 2-phospho-L-lactate transferase [Rhizobiales bacterium]|nr:2-phospho-L-lactate transferase [Hyphomicrobiales bacterium]